MNTPKIILEDKALDLIEKQRWLSAFRYTNTEYDIFTGNYFIDKFTTKFDPNDSNVYAVGSIGFIKKVYRNTSWKIFPEDNNIYQCTHYYPLLYDYLLNQDYTFLPFGNIQRRRSHLFNSFGRDNKIFIRPNSGNKPFTGGLVSSYTFNTDLALLGAEKLEDSLLCLVSTPQNITHEWRLVCSKNKIIQSSLYKKKDEIKLRNECPKEVSELALKVLEIYYPDHLFTLDFCRISDTIRLLEVGGFSCAGLYACDRIEIINFLKENHDLLQLDTTETA